MVMVKIPKIRVFSTRTIAAARLPRDSKNANYSGCIFKMGTNGNEKSPKIPL